MGIQSMKIEQAKKGVSVRLPLMTRGKFRCKNRVHCQDFGKSFPSRKEKMEKDSYLEWQIGYDVVEKDKAKTSLKAKKYRFIGANGKKKFPYELSEILYYMRVNGIISKKELSKVRSGIESINCFLQDQYKIKPKKKDSLKKEGVEFLHSFIQLPTFIYVDKATKLQIEIMIQKQQYATGVQPMVYLCVPMTAFENSDDIIGYTSSETPEGTLFFDARFKKLIFNLLICFGMCSVNHKKDILEIIDVIQANS